MQIVVLEFVYGPRARSKRNIASIGDTSTSKPFYRFRVTLSLNIRSR